jgi:uncharacterized RDD family membrane protein YckC
LLSLVLLPFTLLPFVGGLLVIAYWFLRDIGGASPGKMLLGLRVVGKDGRPATQSALILRNLPFGGAHCLHLIPYVGIVLALLLVIPINIIESILVLVKGERMGDMLAGTMVVKK